MRTKNFLNHLFLSALLLTTGEVAGQVTTSGNVASATTDFLGWDNTVTNNFSLMVRHDLNWPIDLYTDATHRMRLNPSQNDVINSFTVPTDGFLGLGTSPITGTAPETPWTRLKPPQGLLRNEGTLRLKPMMAPRNGGTT